jgi:hypothetical protein
MKKKLKALLLSASLVCSITLVSNMFIFTSSEDAFFDYIAPLGDSDDDIKDIHH